MANDVEERRKATRKQEEGQKVTLILKDWTRIGTRLMDSSEGGLGVMSFRGAETDDVVTYEDSDGNQFPMEARWVRDDIVGLQYMHGKALAAA